MNKLYLIWHVARYEAKLLFRSWAFRIFSILGLFFLFGMNMGMGTRIGHSPYFLKSLSGSLPLMNIVLLNIYQGIIVIFLATEFLKRDRRNDTTQVVFTRSFTNTDYVIGKLIGILTVFAILNLIVLLQCFIFHFFLSLSIFAWQPYIAYTLFFSLPTLIFMIGISFLLINLLRSQAVVFAVMLGYSLLVLILLQDNWFYIFDLYAFFQPIVYSDFIGMGNLPDILSLRGAYFLLGLSCIGMTALITKRLRQSRLANIVTALFSAVCLLVAVFLGYNYLDTKFANREYRQLLKTSSQKVVDLPNVTITKCDIKINSIGESLDAVTNISAVNNTPDTMDSVLLSLNPGLSVNDVTFKGENIDFRQENHLLWVQLPGALTPNDSLELSISYSGEIDDRYCYLDVEDERYEETYRFFLYSIPRKYSIMEPDCIHLTHETGWYPIAGLPNGAAFPKASNHDYLKYTLSVPVSSDLTTISQGDCSIDSTGNRHIHTFEPRSALQRISLTIGDYERRSIEVDSITYSLYTRPGHDYFTPYLDSIGDTLPQIIRDLKNEYEVMLGMEYPYDQYSIVEVPIQFYSYRRQWTHAQEMVQPQLTFIPEMGTICGGTDFAWMKRSAIRQQERANQEETPQSIQAKYLLNFVYFDLLATKTNPRSINRESETLIEPVFDILPNYISFNTYLSSETCPVLNYAFESYFKDRVTPPKDTRSRMWRGMTVEEKANLALKKLALADLIKNKSIPSSVVNTAIETKGRYLLSQLETKIGVDQFVAAIDQFLIDNRYRDIPEKDFLEFTDAFAGIDMSSMISSWYNDTILPGYIIEDVESYKVMDGERTRSQVKFKISNPTPVEGMVELGIRYRKSETDFGPRWLRGQAQTDYSQRLLMAPMITKEIGLILDEPPAELTIDTYVSQNIPSMYKTNFREQKLRKNEKTFESLIDEEIEETDDTDSVYVIDNEDAGFEIVVLTEENWLRNTLISLFDPDNEPDPYVALRFWDPPGVWMATTDQYFHGKFIRSAQYKKAGEGQGKVAWVAEVENSGDYDIFYYCLGENMPSWGRRHRHRDRNINKGEKLFFVYHDDGVEEVPLDLNTAEEGWNFLGTYHLSQGNGRVELTDKSEAEFITADAIKWVKR